MDVSAKSKIPWLTIIFIGIFIEGVSRILFDVPFVEALVTAYQQENKPPSTHKTNSPLVQTISSATEIDYDIPTDWTAERRFENPPGIDIDADNEFKKETLEESIENQVIGQDVLTPKKLDHLIHKDGYLEGYLVHTIDVDRSLSERQVLINSSNIEQHCRETFLNLFKIFDKEVSMTKCVVADNINIGNSHTFFSYQDPYYDDVHRYYYSFYYGKYTYNFTAYCIKKLGHCDYMEATLNQIVESIRISK